MFRSLFLQAIVFIAVFNLGSHFRESSMLSDGDIVSETGKLLPTLNKQTVSLVAEGKTKVIYFFAPWCTVCDVSIGNLQALADKQKHIDVVAVALDYADVEQVDHFVSKNELTLPIALGNEAIKRSYKIKAYPSYYVINERNQVIGQSLGYSTELGFYLRTL